MASIHTRGTVFHPGRDQKSYQELAEAYGQIL
jgi:hypothetical protein